MSTVITITPEIRAEAAKKISDLAELRNNYRSYLSKLCYVWNDDTDRTICVVMGVTVTNTESIFFDSSTADARTYKYAHPLTMKDAESLIIKHNTSVWDAELIDKIESLHTALNAAEAENAQLRERIEAALDKIADIQEKDNWEKADGVCYACGICSGIPDEWQPTDDHCCREILDLWSSGEPLPWEAARRAVAAPTATEAVSIPCPICGAHGHIGDCEED